MIYAKAMPYSDPACAGQYYVLISGTRPKMPNPTPCPKIANPDPQGMVPNPASAFKKDPVTGAVTINQSWQPEIPDPNWTAEIDDPSYQAEIDDMTFTEFPENTNLDASSGTIVVI